MDVQFTTITASCKHGFGLMLELVWECSNIAAQVKTMFPLSTIVGGTVRRAS
jgi:hypothetical protein